MADLNVKRRTRMERKHAEAHVRTGVDLAHTNGRVVDVYIYARPNRVAIALQ